MKRIKVSKNLCRGRKIRTMLGLLLYAIIDEPIAYDRCDGSYIVRPAEYFLRWGEDSVRERLGRFFTTKG